MKRTTIALFTVITAALIYQHSQKSVASDPIPPSLIGEWEDKGHTNSSNQEYTDTLHLFPDGSYEELYTLFTFASIYSPCQTTNNSTDKGSFTVKGNEITFHPQTTSVDKLASCASLYSGWVAPASLPKTYNHSNEYIVNSFSLQNNGQTLEVTQTGGNVKTINPHEIYQKSGS